MLIAAMVSIACGMNTMNLHHARLSAAAVRGAVQPAHAVCNGTNFSRIAGICTGAGWSGRTEAVLQLLQQLRREQRHVPRAVKLHGGADREHYEQGVLFTVPATRYGAVDYTRYTARPLPPWQHPGTACGAGTVSVTVSRVSRKQNCDIGHGTWVRGPIE